MLNRRCCGRKCAKKQNKTFGIILISIGTGLFLAYIIPRYFLITLFGLALLCMGIVCLTKK